VPIPWAGKVTLTPFPFSFVDGALDRADHLRGDADALQALWPQAQVIVLDARWPRLRRCRSRRCWRWTLPRSAMAPAP
jgi:hypothetical protein